MTKLISVVVLLFAFPLSMRAQQPDEVPWGIASSASAWRNHAEWFPKMAEAGASWVRLFPEWRSVESTKWPLKSGDAGNSP